MPQSGIQKAGCALLASPPNGNTVVFHRSCQLPQAKRTCQSIGEIGRIERKLFMLDWFHDPALRRRVQAGLNKRPVPHCVCGIPALTGEIRDRKPENQSY
jgi:TnpA family transposase